MKNGYGTEYSSYHKLAFLSKCILPLKYYVAHKNISLFFRGIAQKDKERIPKTPEEFHQAR